MERRVSTKNDLTAALGPVDRALRDLGVALIELSQVHALRSTTWITNGHTYHVDQNASLLNGCLGDAGWIHSRNGRPTLGLLGDDRGARYHHSFDDKTHVATGKRKSHLGSFLPPHGIGNLT
jgi:hypothetical protein